MISHKGIVVGFSAPSQTTYFIGRDAEIKKIKELLLKKKAVVVSGPAGIGKTALAIKLSHLLYEDFPYGVLWYRFDIKNLDGILDNIGQKFGRDLGRTRKIEDKVRIVNKLLSSGKILLILDNLTDISQLEPLIKEPANYPLLATTRSTEHHKNAAFFILPVFSKSEAVFYAIKMLSLEFVSKNLKKICSAFDVLGYLPLAVSVFLRQVFFSPDQFDSLVKNLEKKNPALDKYCYDNKNLFLSLSLSFDRLTEEQKGFFVSLGAFDGADISFAAVTYLNNISISRSHELVDSLRKLSLVESSSAGRFRIHPLIKVFVQNKIKDTGLYGRLADYYIDFLRSGGFGSLEYYPRIEVEEENIAGIFERCYALHLYKEVVDIWNFWGVFLWDRGFWRQMNKSGYLALRAAEKLGDRKTQAVFAIRDLSWLYYWQGDLDRSYKYIIYGLTLAKKIKNEFLINYAKQRLAKIYQARKNLKKALLFFEESLDYFNRKDEYERAGDTLTYIGETLWLMGRHQEAEKYFYWALELVKKIKDVRQECIIYNRLGGLYLITKNYPKAEKYFSESIRLEDKIGRHVGGRTWNNIGLGLIKEELGDCEAAKKIFKEAKNDMTFLDIKKNLDKTNFFVSVIKHRLLKSRFFKLPA